MDVDVRKKKEARRKFGNGLCNGCNGCNGCRCQEEGSSATDYVTDVTDVDVRKKKEARRKFGNGLCNGCNGCNGCKLFDI
ncbi:hypothetical protein [Microcoleus sp. OTE_8_concoct_300]|uniref:hypothetical protein n=1 Tax=Microcoleus sp. OTE_8_concoct_300 TaxID=2964710 RepID=UPI00403F3F82